MQLLGITGGVGMGKSAAAQLLVQRGVPVADTDLLAHQIVAPGEPALAEIVRVFGNEILGADGQLRREELGKVVFSDAAARRKLEDITHPRILELWKKQTAQWRAENRPLAAVVIPLLFETSAEPEFDATVCLACTSATQRQRLAERGWTLEQIEQRIAAQWPIEQKIAKANYVIWSEGPLDVHAVQWDRILSSCTDGATLRAKA